MITLGNNPIEHTFAEDVNKKSGENILTCYQCGKCIGSCPVSSEMDYPPRKVMQLIKLGLKDELFAANTTWFCLTCATCSGRCPRNIDIPKVMESVRHMIIDEHKEVKNSRAKNIVRFHKIFVDMVKKYGKLYELRLMAEMNIRSGKLLKDMQLAPKALLKGKLGILPSSIKGSKAIKKIFEVSEKIEKENKK